jgi:hypothetical protein
MGIQEFENAIDEVKWKDVYQLAEEMGVEPSNARVVGNKAVTKWKIAESKKELINKCWRTFYRKLPKEKDL